MKLVNYNDSILKTPCQSIDFQNPPFDLIDFAQKLVKFMHSVNGMGVSANQIGEPYAIFAMRGSPQNFVCINPRIIDTSSETVILEEGCLSYPKLLIKVRRPSVIKVRFNTPNSDIMTQKFIGMSARVFQHEMMHMNGEVFWKDCSRYHFDQGVRKSKLIGIPFNG